MHETIGTRKLLETLDTLQTLENLEAFDMLDTLKTLKTLDTLKIPNNLEDIGLYYRRWAQRRERVVLNRGFQSWSKMTYVSDVGKSIPSLTSLILKIITNLWYNLQKKRSTAPSRCEADFDPSSLSYFDCLRGNRYSRNSRIQTIWLKIRTLFPPLWNFFRSFAKRIIFPKGLSSCYAVSGAQ